MCRSLPELVNNNTKASVPKVLFLNVRSVLILKLMINGVCTGAGRGKDMANITGHRGKDMSTILQSEESKENGRPPQAAAAATAGQRRKKRRRLNDLDSDSTVDEEESEEEFCLSERWEDKV